MNKVDELIDALAEHIKKRIDEGNDMENEITEKTKALAELVSARAKRCFRFSNLRIRDCH